MHTGNSKMAALKKHWLVFKNCKFVVVEFLLVGTVKMYYAVSF